jgi:hypothetical protein
MEHATPAIAFLTLFFIGLVIYFIRVSSRGKELYVRRISGIDALDETIGRSVELGRPISFTTGLTGVGPLLYACLGVLHYVAKRAARFGSRLLIPSTDPEAMAMTEAVIQTAYREERRFNNYDPSLIRFLSGEQFAFASGYMGLMHRENVGSAFLFGSFAAESLILAEAGVQVGAVQVAGSASPEQVPFFVTTCDYTLIGEELFAAGAYLSRDPVQVASLRAQDLAKAFIFVLVLFGVIEATRYGAASDSPFLQRVFSASYGDLGTLFTGQRSEELAQDQLPSGGQ